MREIFLCWHLLSACLITSEEETMSTLQQPNNHEGGCKKLKWHEAKTKKNKCEESAVKKDTDETEREMMFAALSLSDHEYIQGCGGQRVGQGMLAERRVEGGDFAGILHSMENYTGGDEKRNEWMHHYTVQSRLVDPIGQALANSKVTLVAEVHRGAFKADLGSAYNEIKNAGQNPMMNFEARLWGQQLEAGVLCRPNAEAIKQADTFQKNDPFADVMFAEWLAKKG